MGILAFLTASRLKTELTRQRDEIARLHQMLDMETAQKLEAEKQAEECSRQIQGVIAERDERDARLRSAQGQFDADKADLRRGLEADRQKIQKAADEKLRQVDERLQALRDDLEDRQRQRSEALEQNSRLAERVSQLEARLQEAVDSARQGEGRVRDLELQKRALETDLKRIMGNLNRW